MDSKIVAGRYQLDRLVGEGGMAVVYLATDLVLHRPVALKILREQLAADPGFVERFQREARAAATLSHPNIVGVFDLGAEDGMHFIVMEYLEGEDLKKLIDWESPLPPSRIARLGSQLAEALDYAHSRGIVHRDVKPQNIFVTRGDLVKVMDFGIAAAAGQTELTMPGSVLGTAAYFSPEQVHGHQVGPASDIYSAGLVLYEMATGRLPFRASNPIALARMHIEDPPPRPAALNPRLPYDLEQIILKCLAKDPSRRFTSAGGLAAALSGEGDQQTQFVPVAAPWGTESETVAWPAVEPYSGDVGPGPAASLRRFAPWAGVAALLLALVVALPILAAAFSGGGNSQARSPSAAVAGSTPPPRPTAGTQPAQPVAGAPVASQLNRPTASPVPSPVRPTAVPPVAAPQAPTTEPTRMPALSPSAMPPRPTQTAPAPTATSIAPRAAQPSPALEAAVARVARAGYRVTDTSSYDESEQLRVLIGSAGEYDQKAFFFLGDDYLGTDTLNPSAQIGFGGQEGNTITIVYSLYRPQDPMESPSGDPVGIRYQWNGTRLVPLEPIPPDDPQAALSRR